MDYQNVELSRLFNVNANTLGIAANLISLLGIIVTVYFYNLKIENKLEEVLKLTRGRLSFPQADSLLTLYLSSVKSELFKHVDMLINNSTFEQLLKSEDDEKVLKYIFAEGGSIISNERNRFVNFKLIDNRTFESFLENTSPLQKTLIEKVKAESQTELFEAFKTFRNTGDTNKLLNKYKVTVTTISQESSVILKSELRKIYKE